MRFDPVAVIIVTAIVCGGAATAYDSYNTNKTVSLKLCADAASGPAQAECFKAIASQH